MKRIKEIIDKGDKTQEMTTVEIERLGVYVKALLIERKLWSL